MNDRCRIGQPGGFDHDPVEALFAGDGVAPTSVPQRRDQIAADGAAQTAATQLDHSVVGDPAHQQVIESDVAELVDDDQGAGKGGLAHQVIEDRGLATAEEAGQQGDRGQLGRFKRVGYHTEALIGVG